MPFFKITDASAEFESATTTITANNQLLSVIELPLREQLKISRFAHFRSQADMNTF